MDWLNFNTEIELAKCCTIKTNELSLTMCQGGVKKIGLYRTTIEGKSKTRKSDWSITTYHQKYNTEPSVIFTYY